jgi:hypothetical protein
MIKKEHYGLLLIILGSVLLNLMNSPLTFSFFDDKEIFKYGGLVIYKGGVPYRDFFDHKPPLIYFFNALNWYAGPWVPWLLDTLLILFATGLFYWLCKKNKLARPWLLPLIFNLLIRYSLVSYGNGMTREYTAAFLLIFFCVMQGNARNKYFILGLLTAATGWMQQDALIILAPFLIYALCARSSLPGTHMKRTIAVTVGIITISIPLVLYFIVHHSLGYLWKDAFLFNLNPPGPSTGIIERIKTIKHAIHEAEFEMAFYTSLILGLAALFLKNKNPGLLYASLIALVFSFSGQLISGRLSVSNAFIYYLLPLSATIPILVYVVFTETPVSFLQDRTAQFIFCLILSTTLLLGTIRYAAGFRFTSDKEDWFAGLPEIEYLKTQDLHDYELFVFDDSNFIYLYNDHKILAPSPWIYHYFWNWSAGWDADNKIFGSILKDLRFHKTRFILDNLEARNDIKNKSLYREWKDFLQSHYVLIMQDSSNRKLWRIQ